MSKLEIGDHVLITRRWANARPGMFGTVVAFDESREEHDSIGVEMDKDILFRGDVIGHDCGGNGKLGRCQWVPEDYLARVVPCG